MVLSLGTAVDANVLIYERTKEELAAGKGAKQAMAAGYSNAFSAIFDSNVTSVITGVILLWFGKGPIQGFATTWIIGIVCSFFSAVYLTRLLYESKMNHDKWLNLSFTTSISKNLMQGTHFHFMEMYKKTFTIAGIALVVFIISFFTRGLSRSIDFTGGRNYVVRVAATMWYALRSPSSPSRCAASSTRPSPAAPTTPWLSVQTERPYVSEPTTR